MDINQNIAECIKTTSDFGSNVVHNICNGTTQIVPWGGADWFLNLSLCVLIGAVVVALVGGIIAFGALIVSELS